MNYDSYKNKPASEKITLAIMDAAKRLVAFELDAGAIYKKYVSAKIVESVSVDGVALAKASNSSLDAGSFYYDREESTLYLRLQDDGNPNEKYIVLVEKLFFASKPVSLPHDLNQGDEVFFEPLVDSTSAFGVELDTVNQSTEAIEGQGTLSLTNDFDFWPKNFDKLSFENQKVEIYSWSTELTSSEAKLLFRGLVESKSYGSKIQFRLKDLMANLKDSVNLPTLSELTLRVPKNLEQAYQRMIFGRVKGFRPVCTDSLIEGAYPISGTISVTNSSATVTGSSTLFLKELSPDDVLLISDVEYTVAAIASNTSLTLTESYLAATTSGLEVEMKPKHPKRFINRSWKLASHALNEPQRIIQAGSTTQRLFLDSTLDIKPDDEVYVGTLGSGLLVTVDDVLNDTQLTLKNSLPFNPSAGTQVLRPAVQALKINQTELRYYRDYEVDALNATLTLREEAEANADSVKESTQQATFTSGSRTVTGSGTTFKNLLQPGYLIRPKGSNDFYEVLSIESDTSLTLRENSTVSSTNKIQFKDLIFNPSEHVLTCEVTGREEEGSLITKAPDIVRTLLQDMGLDVAVDSFDQALNHSPEELAFSIPSKFDEKKLPTYREVINQVNKSVFGILLQNQDFKFAYDILRPKSGALSVLGLDESDVLDFKVTATNKNIVSKTFVEYDSQEFDPDINESRVSIVERESKTAKFLAKIGKQKTFQSLLVNEDDAQALANRWSFLLENSTASFEIQTKLQAIDLQINDVILFSHPKLYERFAGNSKAKFLMIESVKKSASGVSISCVDLSNAFNRACFISNTETNFEETPDDEKMSAGFFTDSIGLCSGDDETLGSNLIW